MAYVKFRFTSKSNGATAGLVLASDKFREKSITDLSRMFPMFESLKMERLEVSPEYGSWEDAFHHDMDRDEKLAGGKLRY